MNHDQLPNSRKSWHFCHLDSCAPEPISSVQSSLPLPRPRQGASSRLSPGGHANFVRKVSVVYLLLAKAQHSTHSALRPYCVCSSHTRTHANTPAHPTPRTTAGKSRASLHPYHTITILYHVRARGRRGERGGGSVGNVLLVTQLFVRRRLLGWAGLGWAPAETKKKLPRHMAAGPGHARPGRFGMKRNELPGRLGRRRLHKEPRWERERRRKNKKIPHTHRERERLRKKKKKKGAN